jgi:hypothetical protein
MNAPATLTLDDPDAFIADVIAFAQRFLDQLVRCEAFMRRLADRVCVA